MRFRLPWRNRALCGPRWPCDFCGLWRPDSKISVVSVVIAHPLFIERRTRRYCKDREMCCTAAMKWQDETSPLTTISTQGRRT